MGEPSTKSSFDNDVWIYIERKFSTGKIYKLGRNKTLVNNCDHHLDRIREIVRDMTGYDSDDDGNYNAYERARNNDLKIKYLREH